MKSDMQARRPKHVLDCVKHEFGFKVTKQINQLGVFVVELFPELDCSGRRGAGSGTRGNHLRRLRHYPGSRCWFHCNQERRCKQAQVSAMLRSGCSGYCWFELPHNGCQVVKKSSRQESSLKLPNATKTVTDRSISMIEVFSG